jgi:deoxyhypusine synthase
VPIFCPAIADSSIGMGLSQARHRDSGAGHIDIIGDIIESANLVIRHPRTASVVLGGGTPKNFINQASVQAEFFDDRVGGHRYALQIVTDVPHFGGASGSSLEEARSWGKLATDAEQVTVHADATIALPLLVSALSASAGPALAARKLLRFDPSGRVMSVNGRPFPEARFEAR